MVSPRHTSDCWRKETTWPLAVRNVYHGGLFGDLAAAGDHAAEKQVFFGGEAEDDARLLVLRRNGETDKVG